MHRSALPPVAVPEFSSRLPPFARKFDRSHSLTSLLPPPAALGSLPNEAQKRIGVEIVDIIKNF